MSDWAYGVLIMVGFTVLAIILQAVVLRVVPLPRLQAHHEVAGALIVVLGTMYGILVATVLVAVWERYEAAHVASVREANTAADLFRSVQHMRSRTAERLRTLSVRYLEDVIDEEWPLMRKGQAGPQTSAVVDEMWRTAAAWNPEGAGETNLHATALNAVVEMGRLRRERLATSRQSPTPGVWNLLIVGAVFVIGFSYFFGLPYRLSKQVMTAALTLMIVLLLFTTHELQTPYGGIAALKPEAFQLIHTFLSGQRGEQVGMEGSPNDGHRALEAHEGARPR
jgi:hypothetical protein